MLYCFSAEEEDQEVMYADVRFMHLVDEGGEEVLYNQAKFSQLSHYTKLT